MKSNKKSKEKSRKFATLFFLSNVIFATILISSITFIHIYLNNNVTNSRFTREATLQGNEKEYSFYNFFEDKINTATAIVNDEYFIKFIKYGTYNAYIDLLFFTTLESDKNYLKISYIDKNGDEILDFVKRKDGRVSKIYPTTTELQKYNFEGVEDIKKGDVTLDLHYNKKIEGGTSPIVSITAPVTDKNGIFLGAFVLYLSMDNILHRMTQSSLFDTYLLFSPTRYYKDKASPKFDLYLSGSRNKLNEKIKNKFLKILEDNNQNVIFNKKVFITPLYLQDSKINMVLVEKNDVIDALNANNNTMVMTILFFVVVISLIFTYFFTRYFRNIFELITKQADELRSLTINLDKKVKEKSEELRKKDRLLLHQNRLAELGDMIANIAHQWRYPITRLSLILQNMKLFKEANKLDDKRFNENIKASLEQIEFMSDTIDNFRNFYKTDTKIEEFKVEEALTNVLNIIAPILESANIHIDTKNLDTKILSSKNELSQVLMNLIINAKDALEERKIKEPKITIEAIKIENNIQIKVKDNAGGIEKENLNKVFEPNFSTKKDKGTGIGLYMAKVIVEEKLKGKLSVSNSESKNENGAIFIINIFKK